MRKTILITNAFILLTASVAAQAGDADALIALDKQWGEARTAAAVEPLLSDDLVAIGPEGMGDKADVIASNTAADAPDEPYMAGDYTVRFLSDDVAVMTHSTSGEQSHLSMHVWQKQGDAWKVTASATVPTAE